MTELFKDNLPEPESSLQDVLFKLIKSGVASIKDFPHLSGFRSRISNLKVDYGLNLEIKQGFGTNRHGRKIIFAIHLLPDSEYFNAVKLYHKIRGEEKEAEKNLSESVK